MAKVAPVCFFCFKTMPDPELRRAVNATMDVHIACWDNWYNVQKPKIDRLK